MKNIDSEIFIKKNGYLATSLWFLIMVIVSFLDPPHTRPSGGRWGWFSGLLWDFFGVFDGFYFWLIAAGLCFICFVRTKK